MSTAKKQKQKATAKRIYTLKLVRSDAVNILRALDDAQHAPKPADYSAAEWAMQIVSYVMLRKQILDIMVQADTKGES